MTLIDRVIGFFNESVPDLLQDTVEFGILFRWNLNPCKNLPNILKTREVSGTKATLHGANVSLTGAMVPIMEQRDVPFRLHTQQELPERSRPFRKFCVHDKWFGSSDEWTFPRHGWKVG